MSVKSMPHFTMRPDQLAEWLEDQPDSWWIVDGDPVLTSEVDFPCPSDELAEAVRRIGNPLIVYDKNTATRAAGQEIATEEFEQLPDINNPNKLRTFLLSWMDSGIDWLLTEDLPWNNKPESIV